MLYIYARKSLPSIADCAIDESRKLFDKITSSLATFEVLISLSIDDGTVIDAKEFHKLQTLYLQLMTHVRNTDRKMKVEMEESFQKAIMDEISNLKNGLEQK